MKLRTVEMDLSGAAHALGNFKVLILQVFRQLGRCPDCNFIDNARSAREKSLLGDLQRPAIMRWRKTEELVTRTDNVRSRVVLS